MAMGGQGPWAVAVMWVVTVVAFVFVILRAYTRIKVVQSYGVDDHVYNFAFLLLVCYTAATTVSAHYGFGQRVADIGDLDDLANTILFEAIGQTFAVVGMAVAKWSLGLFLLRWFLPYQHDPCLVYFVHPLRYSRFLFRIIPLAVSLAAADEPTRKDGHRNKSELGDTCSAGACGIKRTVEVPSLSSADYPCKHPLPPSCRCRLNDPLLTLGHKTDDTVGLIVWSAAEIAVTMICIGIPICRPLYKQWLDRVLSYGSGIGSGGYQKQKGQGQSGEINSHRGFGLRTFGGSTMPGRAHRSAEPNAAPDSSSDIASDTDSKDGAGGAGAVGSSGQTHKRGPPGDNLGAGAPFHEATVVGGLEWNGSEEEILGADSRGGGRHERCRVREGA
ncbi:hypothetical protein CHGG_04364 [Chaetomium globosum CBS 148.51]|uniref:Rhodopsin domain-containing protein n=1 Tax=Chaetomium globosum (strain ATCC 6205 / CBS 148.51 / DSM 1962 / NBRC 6347 / NRRL 1970) TaxID=306901 RepID=Q2H1I2_CHAGB|nr:uncharacterized protein CHGG_04364 [Chaetomium globosum CBS 148.51]EAQ87745.1 hypothetical protein CHGG_04364 [Chaetomium globosum CBS 148.51]